MKANNEREYTSVSVSMGRETGGELCTARYHCDAGGPNEDGGHKFNSGPDVGNPECERCGLDAITWTLLVRRARTKR